MLILKILFLDETIFKLILVPKETNFTLCCDSRKGNRPRFIQSAKKIK